MAVAEGENRKRRSARRGARLSIRLDLDGGYRIGPGKISLLEAIAATGSISAAARQLDMSYRRAWLLVEQLNDALKMPAVSATTGGRQGGGAVLTATGRKVVDLYRLIEMKSAGAGQQEIKAIGQLVRKISRDNG